jgi:4-amino-4-deoxy-L-arabinose transferase-like glycosyltransferase
LKPFLVTTLQAARMPRWLLLVLSVLYVVPGLVGRDPWRSEDAEGFGIAFTMARAAADRLDWLIPNVVGAPIVGEGPLPFWLGAIAMRIAPWVAPDTAFQVVAMLWLALLLAGVWYAAYLLARRPEVQPDDPFGASATRSDFSRAVADCALLVTLATFGLLARVHETTAEAAQVAWVGLFLFGCAQALERPKLGGVLAGLAIGMTTLTRGIPPAVALAATAAALAWLPGPFRLVALPFTLRWVPIAAAVSLSWPLLLTLAGGDGETYLRQWLEWNRLQVAGPTAAALGFAARTSPWFFWPAWPIAAWALWRWRGRWLEPALAVPGLTAATLLAVALLAPRGSESVLLPIAPPLAMLAAFALPTIRRGLISLIDWFAVMTFTATGFVLWAYWIAFHTGWPPRMAYRIGQSVLGFESVVNPLDLALGIAATVAWLALVAWRVSRQPRALWRAMVLSSGGMVLTWFLLMTLWLPAANHRKTYREPAQQAGERVAEDPGCVQTLGIDAAQRASFAYFGGLRFADDGAGRAESCRWLLVADHLRNPVDITRLPDDWALEWRGQRPVDRQERFRLFRRVP